MTAVRPTHGHRTLRRHCRIPGLGPRILKTAFIKGAQCDAMSRLYDDTDVKIQDISVGKRYLYGCLKKDLSFCHEKIGCVQNLEQVQLPVSELTFVQVSSPTCGNSVQVTFAFLLVVDLRRKTVPTHIGHTHTHTAHCSSGLDRVCIPTVASDVEQQIGNDAL